MAIEDADDLRALGVVSGLPDAALDIIIGAANAAVGRAYPAAPRELLRQPRGERALLSQPVGAVSAVSEVHGGQQAVELEADDYELLGQRTLRRLNTGTNPATRWLGEVDVTYESGITENERDAVVLALVKFDLTYAPGLAGQSIAQWAEQYTTTQASYADQRQGLIDSLGGREPLIYDVPIERFLTHRVTIERRTFDDSEGAQDAYGQPEATTTTLAADQPAAIIPRSAGEVAAPHQAGLAYGTHLLYLLPQDVRTSDFIRHVADDCPMSAGIDLPDAVYEVVAVPLSAGIGHHLELDVRVAQPVGQAIHVAAS